MPVVLKCPLRVQISLITKLIYAIHSFRIACELLYLVYIYIDEALVGSKYVE